MVDTIDMIEPALTREIARVSAKRERWLERSNGDVRLALTLNSRIGVLASKSTRPGKRSWPTIRRGLSGRFMRCTGTTTNESSRRIAMTRQRDAR